MFKAPFSFDGRIRRMEYFLSAIILSIVGWIGWLFIFMGWFGIVLMVCLYAGLLWFWLAQVMKRLHDLDKPAWWIVGMFIPLVNFVLGLFMLFGDGTVGPNQYGLDPKNRMPYQGPAAPAAGPVNVTVNINKDEVKFEASTAKTAAPAEVPATPAAEEKKEETAE